MFHSSFHRRTISDEDSDRQLHQSIEKGDKDAVSRLLVAGATVNCYIDGLTPVARAIINKQESIAKELLSNHADIQEGQRLYENITTSPTNERTNLSSGSSDAQGQHIPLLSLAVIHGCLEVSQNLLDRDADINATGGITCNVKTNRGHG